MFYHTKISPLSAIEYLWT